MMTRRVCVVAAVLWMAPGLAQGQTLADFNGTGFTYVWGGFSQTLSPQSVRLTDPVDGWGGGTIPFDQPMDFSSFVDDYLQVDYRLEPGHGSDSFMLEFYDTQSNSVKYDVSTGPYTDGSWQTHTTINPFGDPTAGIGDYANFDFSQVSSWNVLGQWEGTEPFDLSIDSVGFTPTPGPAYDGRDPNAAWRAEAQTMIGQNRMAPIQVQVVGSHGEVIDDAAVHVQQQSHAFRFGSAVTAQRLTGESPDDLIYQQKVAELYNTVVLENDLKWPPWDGDWGSNFNQAQTLEALAWLQDEGIGVRGHTMVWPGWGNLPQSVQDLADDPEALRQAVLDHIADVGGATEGLVEDWDVVNEPRANHDLQDILGDEVMAEWFEAAKAANSARLYLNEYNIITGGIGNETSRAIFETMIQDLLSQDAPLEGLGMQGHFSTGNLSDMPQVWSVLDRFDDYGLPITITELTVNAGDDEQLQADYLRDFMTAVFAHAGADGILSWGFWEGQIYEPEVALFNQDWSLKPAAQAYLDLVFGEWWTDEQLGVDAAGEALLAAFLGEYVIEVEVDGVVYEYQLTLDADGQTLVVVVPTALLGDVNGDEVVDALDIVPFSAVVQGQAPYSEAADMNGDGVVDALDIEPFSIAVAGGDVQVIPEPTAAAVMMMGVGLGLLRRGARRSGSRSAA